MGKSKMFQTTNRLFIISLFSFPKKWEADTPIASDQPRLAEAHLAAEGPDLREEEAVRPAPKKATWLAAMEIYRDVFKGEILGKS